MIGYRKVFLSGIRVVLYHFVDLRAVRFVLDADGGTYFPRVQRFRHYECEYGAVAVYLPEKSDWPGMGINAMVVAISAAAGPSVASGILSIASWHWLFAINVPLGITALVLGIKHLPKQEELSKRKFDYISAIANAITFGY